MDIVYGGHSFQNCLEARWAVFFDKIGQEYEYCREKDNFGAGEALATFYLPREDKYFKIISKPLSVFEIKEIEEYCLSRKKRSSRYAIALGLPSRIVDRRSPVSGIWEYAWTDPLFTYPKDSVSDSSQEIIDGDYSSLFVKGLWSVPGKSNYDLSKAISAAKKVSFR